jgi:DNA invertase Pin-like site-specific DNA recombinase
MTTLAALYRRVSTDHQDNSLEVQETLNTEYCRRLNLPPLPDAYADPDTSGSIPFLERSGGGALMARLRFGDVRHIVTAKQDRLGRDTLDTIATIRAIWDLGITPHFTAEGGAFPRTPQNELLFEIKASVAQYERNLIRERTRAVIRHKFDLGELTGKVPFGFDCRYTFADGAILLSAKAISPEELAQRGRVVSKVLVDNPAEQATIREMARWRTSGWTLERIAKHLNDLGIKSKLGGLWQAGNVDRVLRGRHTRFKVLRQPEAE